MINKQQICEELALDYAERASRGGSYFNSSYEHYLTRCLKREEKALKEQYKIQRTGKSDGFIISAELM